jgi:sugar/nucleoside kinase (ribokinase family)
VAAPDLVVLGNLLVDDVVFPDGRTRMGEPGGATLYASLAAALWGTRTGLVSLRGSQYPAWALDALHARGVDLDGVHTIDGNGLRTWLLYEGRRRRVVHHLDGPTHEQVSPTLEHVPPAWRAAATFHLAPMPFELQARVVAELRGVTGARISLDPHLAVRAGTMERWRTVLPEVDLLFVSEDELLTGDEDPSSVAGQLAGGRLALVLFKRGARGGVACDLRAGIHSRREPPDIRLLEWPGMAVRVVDPTGSGDAFAAGLLAGLMRGDPLERALRRGVVSASFALEEWGCAGLLHATPQQAEGRLREWFGP